MHEITSKREQRVVSHVIMLYTNDEDINLLTLKAAVGIWNNTNAGEQIFNFHSCK